MNELTVLNHNNRLVIESREIAEMVEKRHADLLESIDSYRAIINQNGKFRSDDFFIESSYTAGTGKSYKCYLLTKKGCDMVANKMTGEKGVLFTAAYVSRFEEMEEELKNPFQIPKTMAEALRLAADQQEVIECQTKQLEEQKPKVLFADSVSASHTTILIGDLAKLIKQNGYDMGQKRLFSWMRENGYLIKRKGSDYNSPTQKAIEMNLLEVKETAITHADGHTSISRTPKVTGKGQVYFMNRFLNMKDEESA